MILLPVAKQSAPCYTDNKSRAVGILKRLSEFDWKEMMSLCIVHRELISKFICTHTFISVFVCCECDNPPPEFHPIYFQPINFYKICDKTWYYRQVGDYAWDCTQHSKALIWTKPWKEICITMIWVRNVKTREEVKRQLDQVGLRGEVMVLQSGVSFEKKVLCFNISHSLFLGSICWLVTTCNPGWICVLVKYIMYK